MQSKFLEDYDCNRNFQKVWFKSRFFNDLDLNRGFFLMIEIDIF